MQTTLPSGKMKQKRKMLLVLPLLVLPFITLLFWVIGGEKSNNSGDTNSSAGKLNTWLPDAKLKSDKGLDKLSFYQQASQDSLKLLEEKKADPYWLKYNSNRDSMTANPSGQHTVSQYQEYVNPLPENIHSVDANEAKVYSKLDQLNKALAASKRTASEREIYSDQYTATDNAAYNSHVHQLEEMISRMKENKTEDPEITQWNQMLDKILAIQHPEQVKDTSSINQDINTNEHSLVVHQKDPRIAVTTLQTHNVVNAISAANPLVQNAFYGESNSLSVVDTIEANAFAAVIAETQTLVSGATVKLSLTQDITIQDKTIPKGSYLFGTATLRNERLLILINSIRLENDILPVSLTVYDLDGLEGIYVPGSISVSAVKQSADRITDGVGTSLFNPSLGAQAANAGIETAKAILSKKVKLVKITLPAGYQVLLKDTHTN